MGSGVVGLRIVENDTTPGFPHTVQGWTMSLAHDPALVVPTLVDEGTYVASLNGGSGPDFFSVDFYAEGFTVGCIYSFLGLTVCTYEVPKEAVVVNYDTVPSALIGDTDWAVVPLEWRVVGTPPLDYENVVVIEGLILPITPVDGTIELLSEGAFRRGDYNGDGSLDIADPIFLAEALFVTSASIPCDDACDGNDDGAVDLGDVIYLPNHLFMAGPPLPPPFDACGQDPTADTLGCEAYLGGCVQ